MKKFSKTAKIIFSITLFYASMLYIQSCKKDRMIIIENNIELSPKLSDYHIFSGTPSALVPTNGFKLYELATQLFTDYAEKQRLIKLPAGTQLTAIDDRLPDFPDGTMMVKTFFYYKDKRDTSKGKKIIETRILIKSAGQWNAGTYLWNTDQTDAWLLTGGINMPTNWIDENGKAKVISYHVPGQHECTTCHQLGDTMLPIGPKIRNLNINVTRNSAVINQLNYFQDSGMIGTMNPSSFSVLPDWQATSFTLEQRTRAYMEVNCAHCHNKSGYADFTQLYLSYEIPYADTKLADNKDKIANFLSTLHMPKLGTTIVDEEALALIKDYIATLH